MRLRMLGCEAILLIKRCKDDLIDGIDDEVMNGWVMVDLSYHSM
jgi:hypothetical protein